MIKSDGSLYIPSDWTGRNPHTGRFMKGCTPHNKGRHWDEYVPKASQRKMKKGGMIPDEYVSQRFKTYADKLNHCGKDYPEWATRLMKENYNITL